MRSFATTKVGTFHMGDFDALLGQFAGEDDGAGGIGASEVWATKQGSDMSGHGSSPAATNILESFAPPTDVVGVIDHAIAGCCVTDLLQALGPAIDARLKQQVDARTLEDTVAKLKQDGKVYDSEQVGLLVATSMTKFSVLNERIAALEAELAKARKEKDKAVKDATEAKKRADTAEEAAKAAAASGAAAKRKAVDEMTDRLQKFMRAEAEDNTGGGGGA